MPPTAAPRAVLLCIRTSLPLRITTSPSRRCGYASLATAVTPAVHMDELQAPSRPIERHPPLAPPSYKPAFLRKTQLHRQYTSLLRANPMVLLFQHNNLRALEWAAVRRELASAMRKAAESAAALTGEGVDPSSPDPGRAVRITAVQTGIFAAALRVVEFYRPESLEGVDGETAALHSLSREAYAATLHHSNPKVKRPNKKWGHDPRPGAHRKRNTPLHRVLHGPIAVLSFPSVAPQQLAAALGVLAPTPGAASAFPAPRRRANPDYYAADVQSGLAKLVLLGARVEGRALDGAGVRRVGGMAATGGLDGLRAQLVHVLQGAGGAALANTLEAAGRSLWATMEGRRLQLAEGGGGGEGGAAKEDTSA